MSNGTISHSRKNGKRLRGVKKILPWDFRRLLVQISIRVTVKPGQGSQHAVNQSRMEIDRIQHFGGRVEIDPPVGRARFLGAKRLEFFLRDVFDVIGDLSEVAIRFLVEIHGRFSKENGRVGGSEASPTE